VDKQDIRTHFTPTPKPSKPSDGGGAGKPLTESEGKGNQIAPAERSDKT
jgi:hypothetical protein